VLHKEPAGAHIHGNIRFLQSLYPLCRPRSPDQPGLGGCRQGCSRLNGVLAMLQEKFWGTTTTPPPTTTTTV